VDGCVEVDFEVEVRFGVAFKFEDGVRFWALADYR
jgi:hypothetical protein